MQMITTARAISRLKFSQFIGLLLAIAVAQTIYWYGIDLYVFKAPPRADLAKLASPTLTLQKAGRQPRCPGQ